MTLRFLGRIGSNKDECPTLYATESGYLLIAWKTDQSEIVEIPHALLGFLEKNTYLGTELTDTGRGTFALTGKPVTDVETLSQMKIEPYETAIEVPKAERDYFGGIPSND
ncbi:hypothetical protein [Nocardia terpenica]|uniref:Uncharacterized protein n=1 Tax=Nocardia terpenica TaxID=455432 RepID=A0A291RCB8_9NOCA|nr:hypothetical protein [Nocardia terpenica]ATL64940.1 hypothetical protein CRH09_00515 [Nocardia terpenica]